MLKPLAGRYAVQELFVLPAILKLLLVLVHLAPKRSDCGVQPLDLQELVLLGLGLHLCMLDGLLHLLIVLLEESIKAQGVLFQHLLGLLKRLFTLTRALFQLLYFSALGVKAHLEEEYLTLLGNEVCHVLLLLPPVQACACSCKGLLWLWPLVWPKLSEQLPCIICCCCLL